MQENATPQVKTMRSPEEISLMITALMMCSRFTRAPDRDLINAAIYALQWVLRESKGIPIWGEQ